MVETENVAKFMEHNGMPTIRRDASASGGHGDGAGGSPHGSTGISNVTLAGQAKGRSCRVVPSHAKFLWVADGIDSFDSSVLNGHAGGIGYLGDR